MQRYWLEDFKQRKKGGLMTVKFITQIIVSLILIYFLWLGFVIADQLDQIIIELLQR